MVTLCPEHRVQSFWQLVSRHVCHVWTHFSYPTSLTACSSVLSEYHLFSYHHTAPPRFNNLCHYPIYSPRLAEKYTARLKGWKLNVCLSFLLYFSSTKFTCYTHCILSRFSHFFRNPIFVFLSLCTFQLNSLISSFWLLSCATATLSLQFVLLPCSYSCFCRFYAITYNILSMAFAISSLLHHPFNLAIHPVPVFFWQLVSHHAYCVWSNLNLSV